MNSKSFKRERGFTLLELTVSMAIVAMIAAVVAQALFTTTRTNTKVEVVKEVKQNGDFALTMIEQMLHNARSITTSCSEGGSISSSLGLVNPDGRETTFGCLLDGGLPRLASTSGTTVEYLTSRALTLGGTDCSTSSLSFTCVASAGLPGSVAISFILSQKGAPQAQFEKASQSFQTTVVLRN